MAAVVREPLDLSTETKLPTDERELKALLAQPMWRLCNLYKILVKGDDPEDPGTIMDFKPNRAQRRFMARLWHRNIILKARQLGFTTLICLLWLDHCLFVPDQRAGIVAHNEGAAFNIFRDKVRFAYDRLPAAIKRMRPLTENRSDTLTFSNNSSIQVATSLRSGTTHRLLVSEFGKICAKYPAKAAEVITGTIPSVPTNGIGVIESTAEGRSGEFHDMTMTAIGLHDGGKQLHMKQYRFHFFAWWQEERYRMDPNEVVVTKEQEEYFCAIEVMVGVRIDPEQRAWYCATLDSDFSGNQQRMWQEYPSYPKEAFKISMEGAYYWREVARAQREGRIGALPYMPGIPVNTFWDLGLNDRQAIWFHQYIHPWHHFINYLEDEGRPPSYYVSEMQKMGYVWGRHFLPHDGATRRIQTDATKTYQEMLTELQVSNTIIVPRIPVLTTGIDLVRQMFPACRFDAKNTAQGLKALQEYRRAWNERLGTWDDHPVKNNAKNGADAFRQHAQAWMPPSRKSGKTKVPAWQVG